MLVVEVPKFWKHLALKEGGIEIYLFIEEIFKRIYDEVTMRFLSKLHLTDYLVEIVIVPFEANDVSVANSLQEPEVLSRQNFVSPSLVRAFCFDDGILPLDKRVWGSAQEGQLWVHAKAAFNHPFSGDF